MASSPPRFGTPGQPVVLKADEVPDFPMSTEGVSDPDGIAKAAWAQSHGSIKAFGLLVRDHLHGAIDLLHPEEMARMKALQAKANRTEDEQAELDALVREREPAQAAPAPAPQPVRTVAPAPQTAPAAAAAADKPAA